MEDKLEINVTNKNINKILKHTKKIINYCDLNNKKLVFNFEGKKLKKTDNEDLYNICKAINIKDIKERYSFIYDTVCDYIDNKYLNCNYCDFKDNVCIYFRYNKNYEHKNGCCYREKRGGLCENLKNNTCQIKSISCKLYSCDYLRKNKVNFRMRDFTLIKYFFNIKQKYFIKYSFFKPKSYVIYKLVEVNNEKNKK